MVKKFACPCCGYKTFGFEPNGSYEVCEVCFWEDAPTQLYDPGYAGGANPISLKQAQQNFLKFGACNKTMKNRVRPPAMDELRDENWKPFDMG